jgi:hypothetical protein
MKILTVVSAFGDYARGSQITDAQEIARVLESHPASVVASEQPDPPKPERSKSD